MKVCLLSSSDGMGGGAFHATYRLHQGLLKIGINSKMLVGTKTRDNTTIIPLGESRIEKFLSKSIPAILDPIPLNFFHSKRQFTPYSLSWVPDIIESKIDRMAVDILNLHWICNGYLQIETLHKFKKPLVWTLMDMWPFTGGCHYSQQCQSYKTTCGSCPQLNSSKDCDISRWVWQRKLKAWESLNLTIVSPSSWLAECASQSSIFKNRRIEVIPFGLDINVYKPIERHIARKILNLPMNKQIVLFGAISAIQDPRKGFLLIQKALQSLGKSEKWQNQIEVVIFGSSEPEYSTELGFNYSYLGRVYDDVSLSLIYSAADVTIVPSTQEAFGQTASESLACGTPVVAFNTTGLKDIVDHQKNGYLAVSFEFEDIARGIAWVLENAERHKNLCGFARETAKQKFNLELQAIRYQSLFTDILTF